MKRLSNSALVFSTLAILLFALVPLHAQEPQAAPLNARPPFDLLLKWNTFLGSALTETVYAGMAVDSSNNIYIVGNGDTTWGSPIRPYSSGEDVFVAKLSANGVLQWSTFLGGLQKDEAKAIGLDSSRNIYVAGESHGTWGSPIAAFQGASDAFVAKLDANGTLQWNIFLGQASEDHAVAVAVDSGSNVVIAGWSDGSWGSPVEPFHGGYDAFAAKLSSSGALQWNTFLGSGPAQDVGQGVGVDASGNVYVSGYCYATWGSPIRAFSTGPDAFLAKLNGSGVLVWNTFLGGTGSDLSECLFTDAAGTCYVAGESSASWGSPIAGHPGGTQGLFAAKLDASGTLVWNTFFGSNGFNGAFNIASDSAGNVLVTGYSDRSWGTPLLPYAAGEDAFVCKLKYSGTRLWHAFLGSATDNDSGRAVAADWSGNILVAGSSAASWGSPIRAWSGGWDVFVAKLNEDPLWRPRHAVGDFDGDGAAEAAVDFGAGGIWEYDNAAWSQLSSANPESLLAADVDGDGADEILADLGPSGLWLWNAGAWNQLSAVNVEGLAAGDVDADGAAEVVGDFGAVGLWLLNAGAWTQLSGVNADYVLVSNLDGVAGAEIVGDFGDVGLWAWSGGAWYQLSGVNAEYVAAGKWSGGSFLVGDFGAVGLWQCKSGAWTQWSGVNADYMIAADTDNDGEDEVIGDFDGLGLWLVNSGAWTQLSGKDADFMAAADVNADGKAEVAVDFGSTGLWLWSPTGGWAQLSGVNADYIFAGDFDNDGYDELMADFGVIGLWLYDQGAWTQVSGSNPE